MTKNEFMYQLAQQLLPLPAEERVAALKYYDEYFEDAGPESEARVMEELGSPQEVAKGILAEYAQNNPGWRPQDWGASQTNVPPRHNGYPASGTPAVRKNSYAWVWVVALVLTCPIWGPVVLGLLAAAAGLAAVLIALAVAAGAVCVAGVAVFICSFGFVFAAPPVGLLGLGTGLVMAGLGLLGLIGMIWLVGKIVPGTLRWLVELCRKPFHRAERGRTV